MKLQKHIAFALLSIYSIVLLHDIIPHHHHEEIIVFDFNSESCKANIDENEEEGHFFEHHENCTCNLNQHPHQKHNDKHENCKPTKVQLSKLFVFDFISSVDFEKQFLLSELFLDKSFNVELSKNFDIFRRGPPNHV